MSPKFAARLELARAVGGALIVPLRYLVHRFGRAKEMERIAEEVRAGAGRLDEAASAELPQDRPLRIFLCAAEASGEIHAASLAKEIRRRAKEAGAPEPIITAIGGDRLRALGIETIEDPVARAQTGFDGVLQSLPYYVGVLEHGARHVQETAPDVVVPVDSPALHVPLARMARRYGAPIVHLVAPQYWGWAPWRVGPYAKAVDLALTILPHEPAWFARHSVNTRHVGHPLLDALANVPVTRPKPESKTLALLPGSRAGAIRRNLPWMLGALSELLRTDPEIEVAVLQSDPEHRELIEKLLAENAAPGLPAPRLVIGELHAQLAEARAAFAVSGTILTDVLHHRLPAVCVYRINKRLESWMYRNVLTCPFFASTNLLAGREVIPEHCFRGEGPVQETAKQLMDIWKDGPIRDRMMEGLEDAAERLGPAGAIGRAAGHVLRVASGAPEA